MYGVRQAQHSRPMWRMWLKQNKQFIQAYYEGLTEWLNESQLKTEIRLSNQWNSLGMAIITLV